MFTRLRQYGSGFSARINNVNNNNIKAFSIILQYSLIRNTPYSFIGIFVSFVSTYT